MVKTYRLGIVSLVCFIKKIGLPSIYLVQEKSVYFKIPTTVFWKQTWVGVQTERNFVG